MANCPFCGAALMPGATCRWFKCGTYLAGKWRRTKECYAAEEVRQPTLKLEEVTGSER